MVHSDIMNLLYSELDIDSGESSLGPGVSIGIISIGACVMLLIPWLCLVSPSELKMVETGD